MTRIEALRAVYDRLDGCAVVTIMGAVAAELQSIGHRPNFFYLQHAMGLASSVGLGIALSKPSNVANCWECSWWYFLIGTTASTLSLRLPFSAVKCTRS